MTGRRDLRGGRFWRGRAQCGRAQCDRAQCDRAQCDRGAVDVSVEMLFGSACVLMAVLLVFEATAHWHARNVFDDAASDGVRIAAAYDGSCDEGVAATRAAIARHATSWADDVEVVCTDAALVTITVAGRTPGVAGDVLGMRARVAESAPRER